MAATATVESVMEVEGVEAVVREAVVTDSEEAVKVVAVREAAATDSEVAVPVVAGGVEVGLAPAARAEVMTEAVDWGAAWEAAATEVVAARAKVVEEKAAEVKTAEKEAVAALEA